jgi:hypothetical protein
MAVACLWTTAGPVVAADDESSGSLAQQVADAAAANLGDGAPEAVARAYDNGYDAAQVIESLFTGTLTPDGTASDEEGEPVAPVGAAGDHVAGAAAGADPKLTKALGKAEKRIGKQAATDAFDDRRVMVMMVMLMARGEGYSTEQILVDGLFAGGLELQPFSAAVLILDEKGKVVRPAGDECCASVESDEREATSEAIEGFVIEAADRLAGTDPRSVRRGDFVPEYAIDVVVEAEEDGVTVVVEARGQLGLAGRRAAVAGAGSGAMVFEGACDIGGGTPHPYEFRGDVEFGVAGRGDHPRDPQSATVRIAFDQGPLTKFEGDDSGCVELAGETGARVVEALVFPPFEVDLGGGTSRASNRAHLGSATYRAEYQVSEL